MRGRRFDPAGNAHRATGGVNNGKLHGSSRHDGDHPPGHVGRRRWDDPGDGDHAADRGRRAVGFRQCPGDPFPGRDQRRVIDNGGTIECTAAGGRAIRFETGVGATLNATINNQTSTSVIQSTGDAIQIQERGYSRHGHHQQFGRDRIKHRAGDRLRRRDRHLRHRCDEQRHRHHQSIAGRTLSVIGGVGDIDNIRHD